MIFLNAWRGAVILILAILPLGAALHVEPALGATSPDPCALLESQTVASTIGVAIDQVATPTRPNADECFWAVDSHAPQAAQGVLLTVKTLAENAKGGCRGLKCLWIAQTALSFTPLASNRIYSTLVGPAEGTAIEIAGLGNKATWANGALTVLPNTSACPVRIGSGPDSQQYLRNCENLARHVLDHMASGSQPSPTPATGG